MPVLDVERAKAVRFVKRSMDTHYAGVENELFYGGNAMMLFAADTKICNEIVKTLKCRDRRSTGARPIGTPHRGIYGGAR